ncbi:MAG: UDP-2,3-diacylglucosamine diphosphatase LpxI [Spirochaetia bacterium]|nr:UDP-2,3-diacylglucosamine diphosphatase LpxI [Spirochaetia bacterium]
MKYKKVAVVAGGGDLPVIFLKRAAAAGIDVLIIEIEGEGNPAISAFPFKKYRVKPAHLADMIGIIKNAGYRHVIFLGYVRPASLLKDIMFDARTRKALIDLKDKRASSLMGAAINEFKKSGIQAIPSTYLMEEALATEGAIAGKRPSADELNELAPAIEITRELARLDVGQTCVAGSGMIWAAEAMEGTDNCIKRGGKLAKKGFTVVKMARPEQDMRFDIPAIGTRTLKLIKSLGGRGIIVEAGRTFLLNKDELLRYADANDIFIYGWRNNK